MSEDASTAYICIYCPFNADNYQALEDHMTSAHGHGCQETSPTPAKSSLLSTSPLSVVSFESKNILNKANKREAPDDEQSQSSIDDFNLQSDRLSAKKRLRTTSFNASSSRTVKTLDSVNHVVQNTERDCDDNEDETRDYDERDSPVIDSKLSSRILLTCPVCGLSYHRLNKLFRHAKRQHSIDLSHQHGSNLFGVFKNEADETENDDHDENKHSDEDMDLHPIADNNPSEQASILENESILLSSPKTDSTATECPYCDYKTADREQFRLHFAAHIRDKNYRCLLCNRLYKYRGDCSFHIRRKHHRYSANSNDYIQRFHFDASEGNDGITDQSGSIGSSLHGPLHPSHFSKDLDEPARYFGCPYCDYTSNYGGDVRKHQARKHPNLESKVIKIIRQESEQSAAASTLSNLMQLGYQSCQPKEDRNSQDVNNVAALNLTRSDLVKSRPKIRTVKKTEASMIQSYPTPLTIPPNFAPVRVFQCSSCHQQGTYKWVVERHIRAKHPDQHDAHVIELPAELAVKLQKLTPPLKRFRCSLCPLQSKHTWVIVRHIKHFHTLQTASVLDLQPDGTPVDDESFNFENENSINKTSNPDSESSSDDSMCDETDFNQINTESHQQDMENNDDDGNDDENDHAEPISSLNLTSENRMLLLYKCSLCNFTSNTPWTTQKHLIDLHPGQPKAHMITQCRSNNNDEIRRSSHSASKSKTIASSTGTGITKVPFTAPLSPNTALAKAKFSPAVEEALLSLQNSKLKNVGMYASQPKFGIKRLKCRHCFYRSNWKTDMIRHVRIRHNLTEPDHNQDMIIMTEDEARSTIEAYENTFGKELRRRTFRTWNDWAKAEEEFTPKDGSLQYSNGDKATASNGNNSKPKTNPTVISQSSTSSSFDEIQRPNLIKVRSDPISSANTFNLSTSSTTKTSWLKDDFITLPNPSNIVSRLLLTTASPTKTNEDEAPLDLSIKSTINNPYSLSSAKNLCESNHQRNLNKCTDDEQVEHERKFEKDSNVSYFCSICPYKDRNFQSINNHVTVHLTGNGFGCPLCFYASSREDEIKHHISIDHPTSQTISDIVSANRAVNAHVIERYQCPLCSVCYENLQELEVHRRLQHEFDTDALSSDLEDCQTDDGHETENSVEKNLNDTDTDQVFQCPFCEEFRSTKTFEDLQRFMSHLFADHDKHLKNNQSCPFCSFIAHTTSRHTLMEHIKLHFNGTLVEPEITTAFEHLQELYNQ